MQVIDYGVLQDSDLGDAVDILDKNSVLSQAILAQTGQFGNTPLIGELQSYGLTPESINRLLSPGVDSGGILGSSGGIAGSNSAAPWVVPPDGFEAFDFGDGGEGFPGTIQLPNPGTGDTVVLQFHVPKGYDGVILRFSNNFTGPGFVNGSGTLVWKILRNMQAIKNYDHIINEMGTVNQPRVTSGIRIYSGDLIQYVVNNVGTAAQTAQIICFLGGYFYPRRGN